MPAPTPPLNPGGNSQAGGVGTSATKGLLNPAQIANGAAQRHQITDNANLNIDPLNQPPAMKTLVYSPDVRVIIAHGNRQYDVSADIVRCSIRRAESSAATFYMTLSNKGLRYTPKNGKPTFSRMDRIVVYMKRTQMTQVFSGYLDTVPYKQLYPGTVQFKATCTLKRLMHTWWNPATPSSSSLLDSIGTQQTDGSKDAGMGSILRNLLILVGGWKIENIHIQNFPTVFYEFLKSQVTKNQSVNDKAVDQFKTLLLGSDHSAGPGADAGANSNAGTPGPYSGDIGGGAAGPGGTGTTFYIQQIIAACDERGLGPLVSDNNQGANLAQAGETGSTGGNPTNANQQKAFQQIQQGALDQQQANRNSDAAIIGAAVAMVETGGGTAIINYSNPAVPGSNAWGDGPPPYAADLDSCGIFQQRNSQEWGTVAQRMNPKQAAGMFFDHLVSMVPNWRNMDPAAAAQIVQRSAGSQQLYSTAITQTARPAVQSARQAQGGTASSVIGPAAAGTSIPGPSIPITGGGAAPSLNPNLSIGNAASIAPSPGGLPGVQNVTGAGKPHPDSEGAVQFMLSKVAKLPYVWGGKGPNSYDCSGLVSAAFGSIGFNIPSQTDAIRAGVNQIPKNQAGRGDIYEPATGHVTVLLGPPGSSLASGGGLVQASTQDAPLTGNPTSTQINFHDWYTESGYEWYGRVCANGGPDPTSPYNTAAVSGQGTAPSATTQQGGIGQTGTGGTEEQVARNLFSYIFTPQQFAGDVSKMIPGEKAFIDGQPLIQIVQAVCSGSLRKFMSAPNGDFIAYYPDWWGLDGKPAVFRLEDIEMKDVRIDFSDDPLTTHVYVEGDYTMIGQNEQWLGWLDTAGVATVEDTWLYERLIKVAPGDPETASGEEMMRRYGVRPLHQTYAMAGTHELELILACQVFMEKWAQQYQTTVSMTFMPEILPGMRIELGGHNLSVYVTEVTHVCDFEQGFTTELTIMAPAHPGAKALMATVNTATGPTGGDALGGAMTAFTNPIGGIASQQGVG